MKIKVAITDDHPMVIGGIQNMLRSYEQIEVVGTYACGEELLDGLKILAPDGLPDVLLLDIQLPDKTGEELAPIVATAYPGIRILALTSLDTPFHVRSMLEKGCKGYLLKNTDHKQLVKAIETVFYGEQFLEPELKEELFQTMLKPGKKVDLSKREKEILIMVASELTSQEMAEKLFLSPKTVENHRFSLMQKLGVKNSAGLIKAAMRMGLVE